MTHFDVPAFDNADGTHCFQSAFKSILAFFEPSQEFTWEQLDTATAKEPDLWTWPMAGTLWLRSRGYDIHIVEPFDYKKFARFGGQYLINEYGPAVAREQIAHSNMPAEQQRAADFIQKMAIDMRIPERGDICNFLDQGYLVWCVVNSRRLVAQPGYVGHFILLVGYDNTGFWVNDSGGKIRPMQKDAHIAYDFFEKIWADPNDKAKTITAVKLKSAR